MVLKSSRYEKHRKVRFYPINAAKSAWFPKFTNSN